MKYFIGFVTILFSCVSVGQTTLQELYDQNTPAISIGSSFTLTWSKPTANEDGTSLSTTAITGYEVYILKPSGAMEVVVAEGGENESHTYPIDDGAGVYTFAIATVAGQIKSRLSTPVDAAVEAVTRPNGVSGFMINNVFCETGAVCNFYLGQ